LNIHEHTPISGLSSFSSSSFLFYFMLYNSTSNVYGSNMLQHQLKNTLFTNMVSW